MERDIYSFSAVSLQGKEISLEKYRGKVVLIVNTASKCGLTPQYEGLEELYSKYREKGFEVLGFPCNQFGGQEPGTEKEIAEGCLINYGVTFQMFSKIDVNGKGAHPLFVFLKKRLSSVFGGRIKWNFTKFLIDRNGVPVKRYAPTVIPEKLTEDIERLLNENHL